MSSTERSTAAQTVRFMIVAQGAGDWHQDFTVAWIDAVSAEEAADIAIAPENGYANREGMLLYVIPAEAVSQFSTEQRIVTVLTREDESSV